MPNPYALGMRVRGETVAASVATALAIEGLLGVYPDRPESPAPLNAFDALTVNLSTLFRNLHGSLAKEDQSLLDPSNGADALKEDMAVIEAALKEVKPSFVVEYYRNSYPIIGLKYRNAARFKPRTDRQVMYAALEKDCLDLLIKRSAKGQYTVGKYGMPSAPGKVAAITHYPVDLLSLYDFSSLKLLESHTGKIKPQPQWSTKLGLKDEDAPLIPFNAFTLQVFGDKGAMFLAQGIKLRQAIIAMAKADGWTSMSTMSRIKDSINRSKDAYLMVATKPFL